jgi:hypothetical protein
MKPSSGNGTVPTNSGDSQTQVATCSCDGFKVAIQARLDALESDVRILKSARPSVFGPDADFLADLLPPLGAKFGPECFTVNEVKADPALEAITSRFDPAELGMLFSDADGQSIHGYMIVKTNRKRHNARLFQVLQILD